MTIPSARQCDLPGCENRALNPSGADLNACSPHHPDAENTDCIGDDGGLSGTSLSPETDAAGPATGTDTVQEFAFEAFDDAITWFHIQLKLELPDDVDHDTARDYFRDTREWTDTTIDAKRLGYAPADTCDRLLT